MSYSISEVSKRLSAQSVKNYYSPYELIQFPDSIDRNNWFMTPELVSIYGSAQWQSLSEEQKKNLAFYEAINFFGINIHGEKSLIQGLSQRLYESQNPAVTNYIHHFIDEENKHMYFFGTFCEKYAGKIYPDRKINFPRDFAPGEEELLFFIKVFIFEELVDFYNLTMGRDERVDALSRKINMNHHEDESRHLAFGRVILNDIFKSYKDQWSSEILFRIREYIQAYYLTTWREYYNPDIYIDAGIENPYQLASEVFDSIQAKAHRARVSRSSLLYLKKCGIIEEIFEV